MSEYEETASEIVEPVSNSIAMIEKATIDIQIATAHQYPRSIAIFKQRATEMVTLDEETAQSCIYRRPVGKENGKPIYAEGKSIRMAEIVGACYGNLRVASMIIEQTPRFVKCRGMVHDLESNYAASSEVIESTVTKDGNPYSERMRIVVAKAALSKARRDAIFQVVPAALCKTLENQARETAIGTAATLDKRRKTVLDWINKLAIDPKRVWDAIGVKGLDDVGLEQLEILTGLRTAIKDGDITIDEAFPVDREKVKTEGNVTVSSKELEENLKKARGKNKEESAIEMATPVQLATLIKYAGQLPEMDDMTREQYDQFFKKADNLKTFREAQEWIDYLKK